MSRNDSGFHPRPEPHPDTSAVDRAEAHLGAVEGDRPTDSPQHGNRNLPALDEQGLPRDRQKICEDVIGAREDESTG